ncbi:hypothetical protein [Bradyrhizobium sp. UFLA05-112]
MISKRTKDALAAAKRRRVKLGGDRGVRPTARACKLLSRCNVSARRQGSGYHANYCGAAGQRRNELKAIATGLTKKGIATARGKNSWTETQVARVLERL